MTAKIVTVICGIAITVAALVALNWQRAQPTPGELRARDVSAAAQAAVDVAAARARAAELPTREGALTFGLWALVMAGAIVAIGGGLAVVRAAHVRAGFVPVDLQHPQALVSPAGVMVLSGRQAETAPQAIAAAPAAPMLAAPTWAECLQTFQPAPDRLLLGYGANGAIYGGLPDLLSVAIVGRPGSGKTNLLRVIAQQATMAGVAVYAWDMHDSMGVVDAETFTEPAQIAASAGRIIAELDARRRNGRGRTPVLLMADELPLLSAAVPEAAPALKRIVLEGRKYGLFALLAMAGAAASLFADGTLTRDALSTRFVFACSPAEARRAGLDAETARMAPGLPVGRAILDGRAVRAPVIVALPLAQAQRCAPRIEAAPVEPGQPAAVEPGQPAPMVESEKERILRMHAGGMSLSAIAREVYGTAGGAAFYQVKKVISDTTTG